VYFKSETPDFSTFAILSEARLTEVIVEDRSKATEPVVDKKLKSVDTASANSVANEQI